MDETAPSLLRTSSFRLAAVSALLAGIAAGLVLCMIYYGTVGLISRTIDKQIMEEAGEVLDGQSGATIASLTENVHDEAAEAAHSTIIALVRPDGHVVTGNINHPPLTPGWSWYERPLSAMDRSKTEMIRGYSVKLVDGGLLYVAKDATIFSQLRWRMDGIFIFSFVILIMLGIGGGALLGRGALTRVRLINATLARAMAGDFSDRIACAKRGDEFDHLARAINVMLNRTEVMVGNTKQSGNEIVHDLRSPMARLRAGLELALLEPEPEQLARAVSQAIVQADDILGIFSALLRLAQIESGARRAAFAPVDLSALLESLVDTYRPAMESAARTLHADIQPGLILHGDAPLLMQMVANLMQNAEAFTPAGGNVRLCAGAGAERLCLTIEDSGPGIPAALHETALRRFGRIDPARTRPGAGLGLPMALAIAQLHEGQLLLEERSPGLRVRIQLSRV